MKHSGTSTRRNFLQSSGTLSAAAWLRLQSPALVAIATSACSASSSSTPFTVLGEGEAGDFSAIAARLIPTTETPGATEAGVIHFMDQAFAGEMSAQLDGARAGLKSFNQALTAAYPGAATLSDLEPDIQDAFLSTQENTDLFQLLWLMTIFGFFAMQKYGGNRNQIGWDLIGFEGHHGAWQHPFGYYDAEFSAEVPHGE